MTRIYLAGPMTGHPGFNHPAFHAAAAQLRRAGATVVSPAELHNPDRDGLRSWEWYMRQGLTAMLGCDLVALLDGWETSRGARLEKLVADELGIPAGPLRGRGVKIATRQPGGLPRAVVVLPPRADLQTFSEPSA